jgi:hypothetical protein
LVVNRIREYSKVDKICQDVLAFLLYILNKINSVKKENYFVIPNKAYKIEVLMTSKMTQ